MAVRRSESFRVRRWLQIGAASAGMSAALWGFTAMGPTAASAAAETAGASASDTADSPSSDTDTSSDTTSETQADTSADSEDTDAEDTDAEDTGSEDADSEDTDAEDADEDSEGPDADQDSAADESEDATETDATGDAQGSNATEAEAESDTELEPELSPAAVTTASRSVESAEPEAISAAAAAVTDKAWVNEVEPQTNAHQEAVAAQINAFVESSESFIAALPLDDQGKDFLSEALLLVRRALLNQAPKVTELQFTGLPGQDIEGRVAAVDPEGDEIVYRLVRGPESGTVVINPDGTYTFTPGDEFDGVATFAIAADDLGLHLNLLDLFRAPGTLSDVLVNQGAISFHFDFTTGSDAWTPERREALESAADFLARYFLVRDPVTLHYEVTGEDDPESTTLAAAWSEFAGIEAGFQNTVVQEKLLTGDDVNGAEADGHIEWNFGHEWGLDPDVSSEEYDFRSVAMHELMHSLGFTSNLQAPGDNTGQVWPVFASFVVTRTGRSPFDGYTWDTDFDPELLGENGGLYFGGAAAVAAFGRLIPLYTPGEWEAGSSGSHLDDDYFTGSYRQLMDHAVDTGPAPRILSSFELGLLQDIGYSVVLYPLPL